MKLRQIIRLFVNLIGVYTVFRAVTSSSLAIVILPAQIFIYGFEDIQYALYESGSFVFGFMIPCIVGFLAIKKNEYISNWVLRCSGVDDHELEIHLNVEQLACVLFSTLGLFMMSQTVPAFFQFIAYVIQDSVNQMNFLYYNDVSFVATHLQQTVYHFVAVGFSFVVFMKGKSFALFAHSLKKIARSSPE